MIVRRHGIARIAITFGIALGFVLLLAACSKLPKSPLQLPLKTATTKPEPTQPSTINVEVKDGKKLSLDEPNVGAPADSDFVRLGGKDVHFTLDFQQAQVHEAIGKMGAGKRVEIPARPLGPSGTELQRVLALEVYDNFPNILLSTVEYKNTGASEVTIEKS